MKKKKLLKRIKQLEREVEVFKHDFKREIQLLWEDSYHIRLRITELDGSGVTITPASAEASQEQELRKVEGESPLPAESVDAIRGRIVTDIRGSGYGVK